MTAPVAPVTRRGSDFAELSRTVKAAGLLERSPRCYAARAALLLVLLGGAWTAFALVGGSWWQAAVAVVMAVLFTQVGFLGHDAGHHQVFRSRRNNELLGLVCGNLLVGFSFGWWVNKHTRHHAHPNHVDLDPDVGDGAIAFTVEQAGARRGRVARWLTRHQALTFFPLLSLEGFALHVYSVDALRARPAGSARLVEAALLAAHVGGYLAAVFLVLPPLPALAFIAVHQGLFGVYMGCAFAPNHKGMPSLSPADELDFLRRQVLTSRNIRGGPVVDVLLGGLNYQIEHHLFPSMPSSHLRRVRPIVREFCRERDVAYLETGLVASYRGVLRHLRDVGSTADAVR